MSYYDKEGNPIEMMAWAKLLEDPDYKFIKLSKIGDYRVSTVWLGLDYAFLPGEKHIFETMIFPIGDLENTYQDRYSTQEEAEEGHAEAEKWLNDKIKEEKENL